MDGVSSSIQAPWIDRQSGLQQLAIEELLVQVLSTVANTASSKAPAVCCSYSSWPQGAAIKRGEARPEMDEAANVRSISDQSMSSAAIRTSVCFRLICLSNREQNRSAV